MNKRVSPDMGSLSSVIQNDYKSTTLCYSSLCCLLLSAKLGSNWYMCPFNAVGMAQPGRKHTAYRSRMFIEMPIHFFYV